MLKKAYRFFGKRSFQTMLLAPILLLTVLPILFFQFYSYQRITANIETNVDQLAQANVQQVLDNLSITLDSYDDLLYQIYTDDNIIAGLKEIDRGENVELNKNQMVRTIRGLSYTKQGIQGIALVTPAGNVVFFDMLANSSSRSGWIDINLADKAELLESTYDTSNTLLLPTDGAALYGTSQYHLFHMAHRLVNYKDIDERVGLVVLSIDETVLRNICLPGTVGESYNFVVDGGGQVISHPDRQKIGQSLGGISQEALYRFAGDGNGGGRFSVYTSQAYGDWRVVSVRDGSLLAQELSFQQRGLLVVAVVLIAITVLLAFGLTRLYSGSIARFKSSMQQVRHGDLAAAVDEGQMFSKEIKDIAHTYNGMMRRVNALVEDVRKASEKQKDAEIQALEAQINPHFLYNTLDTINWMALDNDQFEISSMINRLARILRYSIDNSNAIVPLRQEVDWLHQYIYLQRVRFKNNFEYEIQAEESALELGIHKLLFQPFVENAIMHGFKNNSGPNLLRIRIQRTDVLKIVIQDTGCGMDVNQAMANGNAGADGNRHIGMANAIGRIGMYYGDAAGVLVDSAPGRGTTVTISIPLEKGTGEGEIPCAL